MNLPQYDAQRPSGFCSPRTGFTLVCRDHELICLGFEEALRVGWDTSYGAQSDGVGYYLEVLDCSLIEFCDILKSAAGKRELSNSISFTHTLNSDKIQESA